MTSMQRLRGRPAHTPGPTFLTYTPNGRKLVTVGSNNAVRIYTTGSDGEPTNVDDCQENNAAVVASNDVFVTGAEDGTVCVYSMQTNEMDKMLVRSTLPIRDLALSPDGNWIAVASDELTVKVVNTNDQLQVLKLSEQSKPAKHVSFDPTGIFIAVSSSDGIIYLYSIGTQEPELVRKIDGVIRKLDTDAEATSRVVWHPDGRAFAAASGTRDILVISKDDGERQRTFSGGHNGDITALAWSPNGALLASAGADRKIVLWETSTQKVIARFDYANVINLAWHPTENILSFTNSDGELYIFPEFVPKDNATLLDKALQPAPFIHDPLTETSGNARNGLSNGVYNSLKENERRVVRQGTPDSLDEILGTHDDDDFIEDDDGAGYAEAAINGFGKRTNGHLGDLNGHDEKRQVGGFGLWQPKIHPAFQPGSTPWRGNRRYLCLNLVGFAWTVDQDTHNTVTVEFYDREFHRDFHFTDPYLYDKACLNDIGTLFSAPPNPVTGQLATIFYRPHEHWTSTRPDWRATLPEGEDITAIALSTSHITIATSANYLRTYTLYGVPLRIQRLKSSPTVSLSSFGNYVLHVSNGSLSPTSSPQLTYTIENITRDEVHQSNDILALPPDSELKSIFWSDAGDPYIYDSAGVLLVCQSWRQPGQARWIPMLDTTTLARLASGKKQESYFPIAVADNKFHCIILKGGEQYPYFPRPLLSEFDFHIPISAPPKSKSKSSDPDDLDSDTEDSDEKVKKESDRHEQSYILSTIQHSLLSSLLTSTRPTSAQTAVLGRLGLDIDKALLQLLATECRTGEERGEKALEIVGLMRDESGKMVGAAEKVAERFGRAVLGEKIRELAEQRLLGDEDVAFDDEL